MIAEPFALAQQVGFSTARLDRIDALMQAFIERAVIAGGADDRHAPDPAHARPDRPVLRTLWLRYQNTCYQALDD